MDGNTSPARPPLGQIEPHAGLLERPPDDQPLYKIMTAENFLSSLDGHYLHFKRVDKYPDFPEDGAQPPNHRECNTNTPFARAHGYNAQMYFDQARSRTYACCFSLENSDYIWTHHGNDSAIAKVCLVFDFGLLREMLNATMKKGRLIGGGVSCRQIFDINYGKIKYVKWDEHMDKEMHLNPILFTYRKDLVYAAENELRISLSAIGIGAFAFNNGAPFQFTDSLHFRFDYRLAFSRQVIREIQYFCGGGEDLLFSKLKERGLQPKSGSPA